jgi:hypothetical protein
MSVYIRAQSTGEILRNAAHLYRTNFWVLFLAYLLPLVPVTVVYGIAGASNSVTVAFVAAVVMGLGSLLASLLAIVPVTVVLSDICLGNQPDVGRARRLLADRSVLKTIATYLLWLVVCLGGCLLLVVPGIIFYVRYTFVLPVVILERVSGRQALKRSWELSKGFFWHIWWTVTLTLGVVWLVDVGLVAAISPLLNSVSLRVGKMLGVLVQQLPQPLFPIVAVLLYYDLRARKEAYDSAALAEDLRR